MNIELYEQTMIKLKSHLDITSNPNSKYYDENKADWYLNLAKMIAESKMFVVEPKMNWLFMNTVPAKIIAQNITALFDKMFICDKISINKNYYLHGLLIIFNKEIKKVNVYTTIFPNKIENKTIETLSFTFYIDLLNGKIPKNLKYDFSENKFDKKLQKQAQKIAQIYLLNMFLFLNEPRVKISILTPNNKRRKKKGKIPMPSILITNINKELKEYINISYDSHSKLEYSYMVRPHWRTLKNIRYGNNVGKKIFIASYKCGQGPLVKQIWNIKK